MLGKLFTVEFRWLRRINLWVVFYQKNNLFLLQKPSQIHNEGFPFLSFLTARKGQGVSLERLLSQSQVLIPLSKNDLPKMLTSLSAIFIWSLISSTVPDVSWWSDWFCVPIYFTSNNVTLINKVLKRRWRWKTSGIEVPSTSKCI